MDWVDLLELFLVSLVWAPQFRPALFPYLLFWEIPDQCPELFHVPSDVPAWKEVLLGSVWRCQPQQSVLKEGGPCLRLGSRLCRLFALCCLSTKCFLCVGHTDLCLSHSVYSKHYLWCRSPLENTPRVLRRCFSLLMLLETQEKAEKWDSIKLTRRSKETYWWGTVAHAFNASTLDVEEVKISVSSRPARATERESGVWLSTRVFT